MELSDITRARCRSILGSACDEYYPHALESQFPRIFAHIIDSWGTPRLTEYFGELMLTSRSNRQGFPLEVASEIMQLYRLYHERGLSVPDTASPATGWHWVDRRGAAGVLR